MWLNKVHISFRMFFTPFASLLTFYVFYFVSSLCSCRIIDYCFLITHYFSRITHFALLITHYFSRITSFVSRFTSFTSSVRYARVALLFSHHVSISCLLITHYSSLFTLHASSLLLRQFAMLVSFHASLISVYFLRFLFHTSRFSLLFTNLCPLI